MIMKAVNAVMAFSGYVPFPALVEAERDVRRLNRENVDLARRLNSLDEAHTHRLSALEEARTIIRGYETDTNFLSDVKIQEEGKSIHLIASTVCKGKRKDTVIRTLVKNNKNDGILANIANSLRHHKPV
jgi:hypothetical protein